MTPKPQANKTELEIQIADIFWVFGRRGFTDTETVDDSVRKTIQAMLDAMPEKESETSEFHTSDMNYFSSTGIQLERNKGFNKAVDLMESAIKKRGSDE